MAPSSASLPPASSSTGISSSSAASWSASRSPESVPLAFHMQRALPASPPDSAAGSAVARVRWGPVLALAGLHAAISLAWVAHNLYLVELLLRAGFDTYLATVLLTVGGLLGGLLEPLTGALSDRARSGLFRRFFLVMGGVLLSALLFLALPLAAVGARPGPATLVPALLIAWALSMAVFRAPALSLLGRHARPGALPLAASVLTTASALVGVAALPARAWLLSLGSGPTFGAASAALVLGALAVRALERREPAGTEPPQRTAPLERWQFHAALLLLGGGRGRERPRRPSPPRCSAGWRWRPSRWGGWPSVAWAVVRSR